jgi:hypothetical protein
LKLHERFPRDIAKKFDFTCERTGSIAKPSFDVVEVRRRVDRDTVVPIRAVRFQALVHF